MKPTHFALCALIFYAIQNVLVKHKLSDVSPLANLICFYASLLVISLPLLLAREPLGLAITFPTKVHLPYILLCALLIYIADYFYFSAYHAKGSVLLVTTLVVLFPAFASLIDYLFFTRLMPSLWQGVGYVLAVIAVICVAYGTPEP